jgi:hypothetical protein
MVDVFDIGAYLGMGLFIGAFFGFVLSKGEAMFAGVGAAVLGVVMLVYLFTLGRTGRPVAA